MQVLLKVVDGTTVDDAVNIMQVGSPDWLPELVDSSPWPLSCSLLPHRCNCCCRPAQPADVAAWQACGQLVLAGLQSAIPHLPPDQLLAPALVCLVQEAHLNGMAMVTQCSQVRWADGWHMSAVMWGWRALCLCKHRSGGCAPRTRLCGTRQSSGANPGI